MNTRHALFAHPFSMSAKAIALFVASMTMGCAAEDDEADTEPVAEDSETLATATCPKRATAGRWVLCVTTSKTGREWLTVYDRSGAEVRKFEVTTSQRDEGRDDSLTCKGKLQLWAFQSETSSGLKNYFGFGTSKRCQNQGIHYYPYVGRTYDSHGCVRVRWDDSEWLRENVAPALKSGRIHLFIE